MDPKDTKYAKKSQDRNRQYTPSSNESYPSTKSSLCHASASCQDSYGKKHVRYHNQLTDAHLCMQLVMINANVATSPGRYCMPTCRMRCISAQCIVHFRGQHSQPAVMAIKLSKQVAHGNFRHLHKRDLDATCRTGIHPKPPACSKKSSRNSWPIRFGLKNCKWHD